MSITQNDITDKTSHRLHRKQYYGPVSKSELSEYINPFDACDPAEIHICTCTTGNCENTEKVIEQVTGRIPNMKDALRGNLLPRETRIIFKPFPRCPNCMTKYCSKECQIADHKHGKHKIKCARFKYMKDHCRKILCDTCYLAKIDYVTDFFTGGIQGKKYIPCDTCHILELTMRDSLPDDIVYDPDIQRVWIQ